MKCIYCLEDKNSSSFSKVEHIIPKSFGSFKDNFTLKDIVCDDCNQFFGNKLEVALARDTFEGMSRCDHGFKKPSEFKSIGKRSRLKIDLLEGPFKGAHAYRDYSKGEGKVLLKPLPQVGFLKSSSSEHEYFLLDKIPHIDSLSKDKYNFDDQKGILILGCEPEVANKLLKEKGFILKIKEKEEYPETSSKDWLCELTAEVDPTIFRGIAKIGFNYLAYWQGHSFVIHEDFDPIRNYILKGERASYPLGRIVDKPILGDEPIAGKRRLGHMVTINWANDKVSILAQVSLFNWLTYRICLAREFTGEHKEIKKGHFFDPHNHTILELGDKETT